MLIKVIKDSIIHKGVIQKLDTEFECDDKVAESLINRGYAEVVTPLTEADSPAEEEPEEDEAPVDEAKLMGHLDPEDLATYSYQELKALASDLGVSANGKKEELIERIAAVEVEIEPEAVLNELPEGEEPADGIELGEGEEDEMPNTSMPEE